MIVLQHENKNITNLTHMAHNTEWLIYNTCAMNHTINLGKDLKWWVTRYVIQIKRESIYHFYVNNAVRCIECVFITIILDTI